MPTQYEVIKADILATLEYIRAVHPEAAEYLEKHLVFNDERETFAYTGDDRIKLRRIVGSRNA